MPGILECPAAVLRQIQLAGYAVKQLYPVLFFHFRDGQADGRLGNKQLGRGGRHAPCLTYSNKYFQMAKCHVPLFLNPIWLTGKASPESDIESIYNIFIIIII